MSGSTGRTPSPLPRQRRPATQKAQPSPSGASSTQHASKWSPPWLASQPVQSLAIAERRTDPKPIHLRPRRRTRNRSGASAVETTAQRPRIDATRTVPILNVSPVTRHFAANTSTADLVGPNSSTHPFGMRCARHVHRYHGLATRVARARRQTINEVAPHEVATNPLATAAAPSADKPVLGESAEPMIRRANPTASSPVERRMRLRYDCRVPDSLQAV
jgi:hypothetical protein